MAVEQEKSMKQCLEWNQMFSCDLMFAPKKSELSLKALPQVGILFCYDSEGTQDLPGQAEIT